MVVMRLTLNRGIALVSMARWVVPGSGSIVRVSCCAQVRAVCTAVVDEVVEFCYRLLVTDGVVGRSVCVTKVEISASAGVEPQWSVARRAFLGLKLLDELVEASFMGDMAARQLQDALAAQRVFQRLLACSAFCADQGTLPSRFGTGSIDHVAEFVVDGRRGRG